MFSVKCGLIAITRGDTGLITVEPKDGYTPTPKDRAIFTVAEMPGAKTVISKVVTPDESGVVRIPLMSADTNDLPKDRQREYTWSLRYALDAVMTGDAVTGWREMITPIPSGQFVILEANDFPSGVSCPEDERLPVKIESLKGERGEQGERGERGEKGEKGDRGEKGERGERGIQGAQGEKGDALRFDDLTLEQKAQLKGERGERGEKGEQGERGERGVQGIQGATGAQGRQGDTGLRGAKGDPFVYADFTPEQLAALKGEPGRDGAPGKPGKDAPQEAVLFIEQTLDEAQKAQARANIGAADAALQNVLVGSETGAVVHVDDAFAGATLREITVEGACRQDGTPSPDNPVPIEAVENPTVKVEAGSKATDFEPVSEPKAIRIDLRGNDLCSLVENTPWNPQTYKDELVIDSEGNVKLIKRVFSAHVEISEQAYLGNTDKFQYFSYQPKTVLPIDGSFAIRSNRFGKVGRDPWSFYVAGGSNATFFFTFPLGTFANIDEIKEWLSKNPIDVNYLGAETKTIPLGKIEMPALPESASNVWTDAEVTPRTGIEYVRDVNIVIADIESAIASMTAT